MGCPGLIITVTIQLPSRGLKSVAKMGKKKGDVPLPENESVTPEHIVKLRGGLKKDQVREGSF